MQKYLKPKRRFSAFGSLDKKTRRWAYLSSFDRSVGQWPSGENLVYLLNDSTLEVGQGLSGIRGFIWLTGLGMACMLAYIVPAGMYGFIESLLRYPDPLNPDTSPIFLGFMILLTLLFGIWRPVYC